MYWQRPLRLRDYVAAAGIRCAVHPGGQHEISVSFVVVPA